MDNLKTKILNVIKEALCAEYIGELDVIKENDSFILKLYLNQREAPMYFAYQGTEEEFLNYLYKDLKKRQINRAQYFKGEQTDPGEFWPNLIVLDFNNI